MSDFNHELVNVYLADETKLYQDWYQQHELQQHPDLEPIAVFPTLEELRAMAQQWLQTVYRKHHAVFKAELCRKLHTGESACGWWRRIRQESKLSHDLIVAMLDEFELSPLFSIQHFTVTVTLIVTLIVTSHFLDRVCEEVHCDD